MLIRKLIQHSKAESMLQVSLQTRRTGLFLKCLALGVLLGYGPEVRTQTPDRSWPVQEYVRIGMPDPGSFWTAADYATCCAILRELDRTNRAAFPRFDSANSKPIVARLLNSSNTLGCLESPLPASKRVELYQSLLTFIPPILDMYKLSGSDATFHQETVELAHTHLHLLRQAIELDGKPMPGSFQGSNAPVIHLSEATLTPWNAPYNDPKNYMVPRKGTFGVFGANAVVTCSWLIPWLGDRTVIPDTERLAATQYLNEDLPTLWVHIVPVSRKRLMEDLDGVIQNTRQTEVHEGLEKLKKQLKEIKE